MSVNPSAFINAGELNRHTPTPVYRQEGRVSPIEPTSSPIHGPSTPRTVQRIQPRGAGHPPPRPYHMNSPIVRGPEPMSSLVYGFRPEAGWSGVLFQVILQNDFLEDSLKYTQLAFWISFGGNEVPAIRHEMESHYPLPDLGKKRCILQCIVPEGPYYENITAISMTAYGVGGKTVVKDEFIGFLQLIPNDGSIQTYSFRKNDNLLIKWLRETCPTDIDILSNFIPSEQLQRSASSHGSGRPEAVRMIKQESGDQIQFPLSQEQILYSQYPHEYSPHWVSPHPVQQQLPAQQDHEMMQYLHTPEEQSPSNIESKPDLALFNNTNVMPLNRGPLETYSYTHGGMSQSALSQPLIPRRRTNTSRMGRSTSGYGKLTFINKPDQLGDFNMWTPQEQQDNRRIVVFTKSVRGGIINLDCSYVLPQDYKENMMTISCIRWAPGPPNEAPHKFAGQCVFTSVDIILLIEKLVDHNFHVQEKNRIRRNLEGYSPETVKKEGSTHRFFNQVMSYSSPKTRNIEKDIKVFLWDTIVKAMRKIVQKYHANSGVSLGRRISEPRLPTGMEPIPFTGFSSEPSSSESIPTENLFLEGHYGQHTPMPTEWGIPPSHPQPDYPFPYPFDTGSAGVMFGHHEDSGESSTVSTSISPQSQVSQVILPMGFSQDGSPLGHGHNQQQAFEAYTEDDSNGLLV